MTGGNNIEKSLFELIQVAVGNQSALSSVPTQQVWQQLYGLLSKHTLLGIGYVAIQKLPKEQWPPKMLVLNWTSVATAISHQNKTLNEECKSLCEEFRHDGVASVVIKGQSNLENYPEELRWYRTPGDIDLWCEARNGVEIGEMVNGEMVKSEFHGIAGVIEYCKQYERCRGRDIPWHRVLYYHCELKSDNGIAIEPHYRISYLHSPGRNHRLQKWFKGQFDVCLQNKCQLGFPVLTPSVNVVYQLVHLYRHVFEGGVGLRQLMDYYFVLKVWHNDVMECKDLQSQGMWSEGLGTPVMSPSEVMAVLRSFGMGKFARAVMWVLNEVFVGANENDNENENNPQRTRRDTDGCPQADFVGECESSEFKRNLNGCPQADSFGERQLENNKNPQMTQMDTDGCPQADEVSEQQLSKIGQQLKEKFVCQQRTRRDTDGGPQADDGKECESSEFKLNLNGCPQTDSFGERQLENNKYPQMTQMDTDGCPQADFVGEQVLITDEKLMITDCPWLLCEPNEKEGKKLLEEIMKGGNFGQYDTRDAELKKGGMIKHGVWKLKRVMRLVRSYPEEALWEPVFRVWHLGWRMMNG